jgi:hypothetical protein
MTGRAAVRVRTGVSIIAALALAVGLSACSVFSFPHTQEPYNTSDGVSASVGEVEFLNLIVFTDDGENGNLSGAVVNRSEREIALTLQYVSDGEKVNVELTIPEGRTFRIGSGEGGQLFLPAINSDPGSLLTVYFQYGDNPGAQTDIPVLDAALSQYEGLLPTPTPTPTPTVTATPEPSPTPTP